MQLTKGKVATLNFVLTDDEGNTIDESRDGTFRYLHGAENIIPGLERELEGSRAGDSVKVVVEAKDAYGERDPARISKVPMHLFPDGARVEAGMEFYGESESGRQTMVRVTAVESDGVVVDANHPLAGQRLHFDLEIVEVRDASSEELSHGHVHEPGEHTH